MDHTEKLDLTKGIVKLSPRLQELHDFLQGCRLDQEFELEYSFKGGEHYRPTRKIRFIAHDIVQELEAFVNED